MNGFKAVTLFCPDVSHADDEAVTVWWMLDDTPIHNIKVRCDNLISTSTDAVQVQVHQRLHNIALTVTNTDITQTFGFLTRYVACQWFTDVYFHSIKISYIYS